jgi:hypothetical protein
LVWVPRILYSYRAATADANNYWLLGFAQSSYVPSSGTVVGSNWQTGVFTINNNLTANGSHQINRVLSTGGSAYSFATVPSAVTSLIGTPGSLSIMYNYICHYVHPVPASPI